MEDSEKHDEDSKPCIRVLRSATDNVPERFSSQKERINDNDHFVFPTGVFTT
jgi:hypothetical protein